MKGFCTRHRKVSTKARPPIALLSAWNDRCLASVVLLLLASTSSYADGFGILSRHEDLQNHAIVDTGDFERIAPPFGKIGAPDVLKLRFTCYEPVGSVGLWGIGKKAGLILISGEKHLKIALLDPSVGSIDVKVLPAVRVSCPTSDMDGTSINPEKLQELKRKQEALQRELDRLRQQKQ